MEITSYKYTAAVQALIYCKWCNDNGYKATSSTIAAAIGVDGTILRVTLTSLNRLGYVKAKPGPGGMIIDDKSMSKTLLELFDDLNEKEGNKKIRTVFNIYEPYNDGNKTINKINKSLSKDVFNSDVFNRFSKITIRDIYEDTFVNNQLSEL